MKTPLPTAILYCCDHNAVRSPMAEGLMKKLYGEQTYVQSAGLRSDKEIDGFSIAVCAELGIELSRHKVRSFDEMQDWGDDLASFDMVIALSQASFNKVQELAHAYPLLVEFWPIIDPTGKGQKRDEKLEAYREVRDQIMQHMMQKFGPSPHKKA